ncbi:MAG: DUF4416 family protein [candidate division KSB1 bacterium]|nr:DUF4416 family protein [candidate division KSB1 bacterium]
MEPQPAKPVKLFIGVLFSDAVKLEEARSCCEEAFGPIDWTSPDFPFDVTTYYCAEMGEPITRRFWSFARLVQPDELPGIKLTTNRIEAELAVEGKRKVNLDPGYLDYDKVVLASAKYNGQKIYLRDGIYADLTLHYEKGHFYPYPWSFPDFKSGRYERTFLRIRELYKVGMARRRSYRTEELRPDGTAVQASPSPTARNQKPSDAV